MQPYATNSLHQERMLSGAMRALDARNLWFDGLYRHVFGEASHLSSRPSGTRPRFTDIESDRISVHAKLRTGDT
jgi:hypothetical protein